MFRSPLLISWAAFSCRLRTIRFAPPIDCWNRYRRKRKVRIVDIHAEATSEKVAMGWYLDGRVSAVVGTHTHVQTADERILPAGTAYLTDMGMTGSYSGVIGMNKRT